MTQTPGMPGGPSTPGGGQYTPDAYPPGQYGYGGPNGPQGPDQLSSMAPGPAPRRSRKAWWIGGGVLGVAALGGAGVFAASWFFSTGAQPAEALPADTIAYVAIDMDPSGAQKVEALKTLQKFPAIKENLKLDAKDDLRPLIFEEMVPEECDLDYDRDVKPWLGERFAMAAVRAGGSEVIPAGVVQVSSEDGARKGLDKLAACASPESGDLGTEDDGKAPIAFTGEWLVISDTESHAKDIVAQAAKKPLDSDTNFQKWVDEAGGEGIVTAYAGPGAGDVMADELQGVLDEVGGITNDLAGLGSQVSTTTGPTITTVDDEHDEHEFDEQDGLFDDEAVDPENYTGEGDDGYTPRPTAPQVPEEALQRLRDFEGGAIIVRFADSSVEVELSGGMKQLETVEDTPGNAGDLTENLPTDTMGVVSFGIGKNLVSDLFDQLEEVAGDELDLDQLKDEAAKSGITLPDDLQTLLGDGVAVTIGGDFDAEEFADSAGPEDVPFGIITGAPKDDVQKILDQVRGQAMADEAFTPAQEDYFTVGGDQDRTVWAPNAAYRSALEKGGKLGQDDTYRGVVTDRDAQFITYVNLDELVEGVEPMLANEDPEVRENVEPLEAFGVTGSVSNGAAHLKLKLTTD